MQYVAPESDLASLRMPSSTMVLTYAMKAPENGPHDKEFRLGSKQTMRTTIILLETMLSRACTGMMTNTTLLGLLKVKHPINLVHAELVFKFVHHAMYRQLSHDSRNHTEYCTSACCVHLASINNSQRKIGSSIGS